MCDAQEEVRHFERGERESVPLEADSLVIPVDDKSD